MRNKRILFREDFPNTLILKIIPLNLNINNVYIYTRYTNTCLYLCVDKNVRGATFLKRVLPYEEFY